NALSLEPDTNTGTTPPTSSAGSRPSTSVTDSGVGASSKITCAFVPETPNDETPARRGRSPAGQSTASDRSLISPDPQSTCGDGSSAHKVLGNRPWRIASTILITPATPAAVWV